MSSQVSRVLVVGAGPVGMAGALELNRLGANVRIVEKEARRGTLSKAVGINARTLELLEPAGVSARLIERGLRISRVNLSYDGQVLTAVDFSRMQHRFNFMLSLPQDETEAILEDALRERGVIVECGVEFTGYEESADSVSALISGRDVASSHSVDYLLGADGAHSRVRKAAGIHFAGEPYEDTWSLADVRMDWPFGHGEAHLLMRRDGRVLFVMSMPNSRYRLISNSGDALDLLPADSSVRETLWETTFSVSLRQVDTYRKGRAFLAGDAAHIHSPAGGRGMNLGIEDAVVFARRLAADDLERYSADRYAVGQQVVRESDMQFRMASARHPLARLFRNIVIRNVLGAELVQREFRRRMAGIDHVAT